MILSERFRERQRATALLAGLAAAGGLGGCKVARVAHDLVAFVTTPCPYGAEHVVSSETGTPGLKKLTEKWCQERDERGEAVRHGPYVEVYESGTKREAGRYRHGRRDGTWTRSYPSGRVDTIVEYENGKPLRFLAWHDNGQKWEEGGFEDGLKQGVWIRWWENGQKEFEGYYSHGVLDRLYTLWHDNGQKQERGEYRNGARQGLWTTWHGNGQKRSEILFRDDKPHDWYRAWHENGQPSEQALFHDGKPEGTYTIWHDNGQKEEEGSYRDGLLEGQVIAWDRDGQVWMKTQYRGGSLVEDPMPAAGQLAGNQEPSSRLSD
ncbi:MAG: toxin-antitoxin system YwqK family antitoxin [Deltaproteobacteria bacterium]|nr:toxin-antitoxin system YwqK family antitoxin [Deltaproteobacteria bacterium]